MENNSNRQKELVTVDREHSETKTQMMVTMAT